MDSLDDHLEVFFGQTSHAEARVYAQWSGEQRAGLTLRGKIDGPTSVYARTLPARAMFRDTGPGPSVLAEAMIPDPCFWTPATPHLYTVQLELLRDDQIIAHTARLLGIRPLGTDRANLVLDNRRWVVRGVSTSPSLEADFAAWHGAGAALVTSVADDALCRSASEYGVLIIALVASESAQQQTLDLRRLARWPAVGIAAMTELLTDQVPRNLLLVQRVDMHQPEVHAPWAKALLCDATNADAFAQAVQSTSLPAIAIHSDSPHTTITAARAACDRLQRDLAPIGDFAGYLV